MSRPIGGSNGVNGIAMGALLDGRTTDTTIAGDDQMDFNSVQVAHSQLTLCLRTDSPTC